MVSDIRLVRSSVLLAVLMVLLSWGDFSSVASAAVVGDPAGDGKHVWVSDMGWWASTGATGAIRPSAVAVDDEDHLYVADNKNATTGTVWVFSQSTGSLIDTWAVDYPGKQYANPQDIAVDASGSVHVLLKNSSLATAPETQCDAIRQYDVSGTPLRTVREAQAKLLAIATRVDSDGMYVALKGGSMGPPPADGTGYRWVENWDASGSLVTSFGMSFQSGEGALGDIAAAKRDETSSYIFVTRQNDSAPYKWLLSYILPPGTQQDYGQVDGISVYGVACSETGTVFVGEYDGVECRVDVRSPGLSQVATISGHANSTGTLDSCGPVRNARRIAVTPDGGVLFVSDNSNGRVVRFIQVPRCELRFATNNPTSQGADAFAGRAMATSTVSGVTVLFEGVDGTVACQATPNDGTFDSEDEIFSVDSPDGVWQHIYAVPRWYSTGTTWTEDWGHVTGPVKIDGTPPSVTDDAPSGWVSGSVTVTLSAVDTLSAPAVLYYSTDGSTPTVTYSGCMSITAEGTTTLKYLAVDGVGNTSTVTTKLVRIDNTEPGTSDDAPSGWVSGPVAVILSAVDTCSGVADTYWWYGTAQTTEARYDQTATPIAYSGTWTIAPNAEHYNGAYQFTNGASAGTATVNFVGTSIRYITAKAGIYGKAWVRLDSEDATLVDLYSQTTMFQQTAYSRTGLDDAPHTLQIWWSGSKNASSGNTYIGIDAVGVTGRLVDASESVITTYTAPVEISTEGTTVLCYYSVDSVGHTSNTTTRQVCVDSSAPDRTDDAPSGWVDGPVTVHLSTVDTYSGTAVIYYSTDGSDPTNLYSGGIPVMAEGTTTVKYLAVDGAGNTSTVTTKLVRIDNTAPDTSDDAPSGWVSGPVTVTVSAVDTYSGVADTYWWYGTTQTTEARYDQTATPIAYSGSWTVAPNVEHYNGAYQFTTSADPGTATVNFVGTSIDYITAKASCFGMAWVRLDSEDATLVDLYSQTTTCQQTVYSRDGLADAPHTLQIWRSYSKNTSSTFTYIGIDAIDVTGRLVPAGESAVSTYTAPIEISTEGTTPLWYYSVDVAGNATTPHCATVMIE